MLMYEVERGNYWRQNVKLVVGCFGCPACQHPSGGSEGLTVEAGLGLILAEQV